HDTQRRIVYCRSAQRVCELFLVCVGRRQSEEPVPVATCTEHIDQRLDCIGVLADKYPGRSLAGFRAGEGSRGSLPADLVAVIRDGLACTLLVVLCRKLGQHIEGLTVVACTVEQGREFLDPPVLEKTYGLGARDMLRLCVTPIVISIVSKPVLAA